MKEHELAEKVRNACIKAAREGFMNASISGLCTEGAMEAAISAMQSMDIEQILEQDKHKKNSGRDALTGA